MLITFLLFGLVIGVFQTFILRDIVGIKKLPKWLMVILSPSLIILCDFLFDDQITAFALFGSMASIFIFAIVGLIFQNNNESSNSSYNRKSYNEVVKDFKQPVYLNPLWGIVYQLYVIVMIGVYIFVPKETYNSEVNYNMIENDLLLQIISLFVFTGFSILILFYQFLDKQTIYFPSIFKTKKIISTPEEFRNNKLITIGITIFVGIIFLIFCYDHGVYHMLVTLFQSFDQTTLLSINTAVLAFIFFNIVILFINPKDVAKRNMIRIATLIRSAFLSIFISAALVIPLMIIQDKFTYFNMSSEILLFLGFNFVLLVNEISLYVKYRKGIID